MITGLDLLNSEPIKPTRMPQEWFKWLGPLPRNYPFLVMLSGTEGSGKTTLLLKMLNRLCNNGDKALYLNYEEPQYRGATMPVKLKQNRISKKVLRNSLYFPEDDEMDKPFEELLSKDNYRYCVIDSVSQICGKKTSLELELKNRILEHLKNKKNNTVFFVILHYVRTSKFSGMSGGAGFWRHEADLRIWLEKNPNLGFYSTAQIQKSRYADKYGLVDGHFDIWQEKFLGKIDPKKSNLQNRGRVKKIGRRKL